MLRVRRPAPIAQALHRGALGRFTAEDRDRFAAIEQWRADLEQRTDELHHSSYRLRADGTHRDEVATVGETCRRASAPPFWGRVLYSLAKERRPAAILEMGTCFGISTAYLATGHPSARVTTLEGEPAYIDIAREGFEHLGIRPEVVAGRFQDTLTPALDDLGQVELAFVDGHHEEEATLAYFELLLPRLAPGAIVVFDDIAWSEGMENAWRTITARPEVGAAVDLRRLGVIDVPQP